MFGGFDERIANAQCILETGHFWPNSVLYSASLNVVLKTTYCSWWWGQWRHDEKRSLWHFCIHWVNSIYFPKSKVSQSWANGSDRYCSISMHALSTTLPIIKAMCTMMHCRQQGIRSDIQNYTAVHAQPLKIRNSTQVTSRSPMQFFNYYHSERKCIILFNCSREIQHH